MDWSVHFLQGHPNSCGGFWALEIVDLDVDVDVAAAVAVAVAVDVDVDVDVGVDVDVDDLNGEGAHEHVAHPGQGCLQGLGLEVLAPHLGTAGGATQGDLGVTSGQTQS